jgi:hypothetical protein
MKTVLRIGMTKDEFFAMCDDLMESFELKVGSPTISTDLVSIYVAEGDVLLCFLTGDKLSYVEYKGDIFMGGE